MASQFTSIQQPYESINRVNHATFAGGLESVSWPFNAPRLPTVTSNLSRYTCMSQSSDGRYTLEASASKSCRAAVVQANRVRSSDLQAGVIFLADPPGRCLIVLNDTIMAKNAEVKRVPCVWVMEYL
jgi:hypothetical protein